MEDFSHDWDLILSIMLDNCNKRFQKTKEAEYLKKKCERMEENCQTMLAPDDIPFVEECFSILCEAEGAKTLHAYQQGYKDCVYLLKKLKILE